MQPARTIPAGDEFIPTRLSLLSRLKRWDDQESWRDFFDTYWRLLYGVALRAGLTESEAQDVVQETLIAVAQRIEDFRPDPALGSFKNWLLQITRRRVADRFRQRHRPGQAQSWRSDETTGTPTIERIPDPASLVQDTVWEEEWEHNLADVAMSTIKNRVSPKQWLIFHQLIIEERPAREVAVQCGVGLGAVYVARHRITALIKQEVRRLAQELG